MIKNYLTIAYRNIKRQKVFSLVNLSGLVLGIVCSVLILLFIQYELSYDRFHKNADQIYRIIAEMKQRNSTVKGSSIPAPMAPELIHAFPEIIDAVRLSNFTSQEKVFIKYQQKSFEENGFFLADSSIFKIFTFPLLQGDPQKALRDPNSIVITQDMAKKYFDQKNPLGEVMTVNNTIDFRVTGVLKNIPGNSHLRFNFLVPMSCSETLNQTILGIPGNMSSWRNFNCNTYLLLPENYPPPSLERKFPQFIKEHMGAYWSEILKMHLQPLNRIHLYSDFKSSNELSGDIKYVTIFSGIAFFILLIACINFINLSTAHYGNRVREVGLRKVVGASRAQLIKQFLGESLFITLIAFILALVLVELTLPAFCSLIGEEIRISESNYFLLSGMFIGLVLVVGFLSGTYPALFLSSFQPESILKGTYGKWFKRSSFRNILVVVQFSIMIFLIIGTLIIHSQLSYIKNKKLGFTREQVVVLPIKELSARENYKTIKLKFLQNPDVVAATASSKYPGGIMDTWINIKWEGYQDTEPTSVKILRVDYDFIKVFDLQLLQGRDFSEEIGTDRNQAVILNESAVRRTGWKSPLGKRFGRRGFGQRYVIGVVKDFHYSSLYHKIEPLALVISPRWFKYLSVKIRTEHVSETIAFLKKTWYEFNPNHAFEYFFLDDYFDRLYRSEERLGHLFGYFSLLAIVIASLGLFGMASFAAQQRIKEIGIRKVFGAPLSCIILMFSKESTRWVVFANFLAWPVAWYTMNRWLENFAYHIKISWGVFVFAGGLALVIALLTISTQAMRAALANPVEALRYE